MLRSIPSASHLGGTEWSRCRDTLLAPLLLVLLVGTAPHPIAAGASSNATPAEHLYAGRSLTEVLLDIEDLGLTIIFSSELVHPDMKVEREPTPGPPLAVLAQVLAPHGLTYVVVSDRTVVIVAATPAPEEIATAAVQGMVLDHRTGMPVPGAVVSSSEGSRVTSDRRGRFHMQELHAGTTRLHFEAPGYIPDERRARLSPGATQELLVELERREVPVDEIVVTPSRIDIASDEPLASFGLPRHEVETLPNVSGDAFRAAATLPGAVSSELSAQLNIRGGREDELLVLLDGIELYEPYHLQDLNSALSIVAPQTIDSLELSSGGFSVAYGDRMSGLMDIRTRRPRHRLSGHLGFSLLDLQGSAGGQISQGRGSWLVAGRQGLVDRTLEVAERDERPRFWDAFAKGALQITPSQEGRIEWIQANDRFTLDDPTQVSRSGYRSTYLWAGHQALVSQRVLVESILYLGDIDHDRKGRQDDPTVHYHIGDRRLVDVRGLRQDWSVQLTPHQSLKSGLGRREIESHYDYRSELDRSDPLSAIRTRPARGTTLFDDTLSGTQSDAYASYRVRPASPLTLELGLRFDENHLAEDQHLSPRLNLVYSPGKHAALRFSWGTFYQSQRPNELQVTDGETELFRDERSDLVVAGYERALGKGTLLRAEIYRRDIDDPRVRWENLFDPISIFPELEADRVRIDPEQTRAQGFELFLRHDAGSRVRWRVAYALAEIVDSIEGASTPRSVDQTHALQASLDTIFRHGWHLNLTWSAHTGWPTTSLFLAPASGNGDTSAVPVLGPINQQRLTPYHRLDARLSRELGLGEGTLTVFLDLLNVYDRRNVRGFEVATEPEDVVSGEDPLQALHWIGLLPSFGLRWEF